jgi:hypothetical protein
MDGVFKGNAGQARWGSPLYTDGLMAGTWHVKPRARRRNVRKDDTPRNRVQAYRREESATAVGRASTPYTNRLHSVRHGTSKPG